MQQKTLIISSSVAVLTAFIIYSSMGDGEENKTQTIEKQKNVKVIKEIKKVKAQTVTKIIETKVEETILVPQITPKKKKIQTKYSISILPQNMTVQEKKQRFRELLVPAVNNVYTHLEKQYNETKEMIETDTHRDAVETLMKEYNASSPQDLLSRLKPHPRSIALAQSTMQSGWATSRFTLIANNLFGVWSFDENEPRVQAHETRDGEVIYVKRYASLQESIEDYYKLLATSPLFEEFRAQKMKSNDPYELIKKLDKYYKNGDNYQEVLSNLIKYNKCEQYDLN